MGLLLILRDGSQIKCFVCFTVFFFRLNFYTLDTARAMRSDFSGNFRRSLASGESMNGTENDRLILFYYCYRGLFFNENVIQQLKCFKQK